MDDGGHIREHLQFDNLMDPSTRSEFMELVTRRKPKVITVGGFTVLTLKLWERVREVLGYKDNEDSSGPATFRSEDQVPADGHNGPAPPSRSRGIPPSDPNLVPVIWVPDHVARIFQHSKRAAEEFGSLPEIGRYCAGLARYIQSPLNEYAALGADITAISFHEDQQLVKPMSVSLSRSY
jgi:transcription elongation factor SPT6